MSDIGDQIERGSEGPEWVERASNAALRKEIERLNLENNKLHTECGHLQADVKELRQRLAAAEAAARWLYEKLELTDDMGEYAGKARSRWPWLAGGENDV